MSEVNLDDLPAPNVHVHKRRRLSAIWIVPIIAIAAAGALAVRTYLRAGPTIKITFQSADGIQAGITDVRYKNVPVGKITDISISDDLDEIVATVSLSRGAAKLAAKDTKFWVEKPRVGVGGVSGLSTLLSGAYIGVDVGTSHESAENFVGLEHPPGVLHDERGRRFKLTAMDGGSLAPGSPVYLRRNQVGQITDMQLAPDGKSVDVEVFVLAPWDRNVTDKAVWWNASGLDVTLDANGLRVDTQSLATVVAGGIAFGYRDPDKPGTPTVEGARFPLYDDRGHAMAKPDMEELALALRFDTPVRGLSIGASIDFDGITIGQVDKIRLGWDEQKKSFFSDVDATVYPHRLGGAYKTLREEGEKQGKTGGDMLQALVPRGLRAQLRSGNLLTGQSFVALAMMNNPPPAMVPAVPNAWVVPTVRGGTDQIQDQVASIVSKIDRIPFDKIGDNANDAAQAASTLMKALGRDVVPDAKKTLEQAQLAMAALREGLASLRDNVASSDAPLQQSMRSTLDELERAAMSLRGLADYLKHHPETIVRGRP